MRQSYELQLVVDMVAGKHDTHGRGIAQAAVRAVRGKTLIASVGPYPARQVVEVGKGMQAELFVADTHPVRVQLHVLQHDASVRRQGQVPLDDARAVFRSRYLFRGQPLQPGKAAVIHDTLELSHRLHETLHRLPVLYLLRHQKLPAQRVPVALLPGAFPGGLGEKQVAGVVEVGPFVEVAFKTAGEEARAVFSDVGSVFLRDENILLVDD